MGLDVLCFAKDKTVLTGPHVFSADALSCVRSKRTVFRAAV